MTAWIRDSRNARAILVMLFALVLAIRVAIPVGFMPTQAPNGIVISVCTGMGQAKAFLPIEKDSGKDRHSTAEQPCIYAAGLSGAVVLPLLGEPGATFALVRSLPGSHVAADPVVRRLAAPPPPALGPPSRA